MFVLSLLLACVVDPASIKFDGPPSVTVNSFEPVPVAKSKVLDKEGKPIEGAITSITVTPADVATLKGTNIVPLKNGEATVMAHLKEISGSYKLVIAKPDRVDIADWIVPPKVGGQSTVVVTVYAGETVVSCPDLKWSVDNEAVVKLEGGDPTGVYLKAQSAGPFTLTATCKDVVGTRAGTTEVAAAP
ncbi:MAG: hypothetical protein EXR71_20650 [Myxococcales bacterium]|nr:hypothetical protein [Myxococcales bacterium]